jgi:hypothetical protein
MKRTISVFLISLACLSCGNKQREVFKPQADTSRVLATYVDLPTKNIKVGVGVQVIRRIISVDSLLKAKIITDTMYYILHSSDTSGKYVPTFKDAISTHINVDTGIARLSRWIATNKSLWERGDTSFSSPQNKPVK